MISKIMTTMLASALLIGLNVSAFAADQINIAAASLGFLFLPAMAADELGYFKQNNIEVTFLRSDKGPAAVIGGQAQFYMGPASTAVKARSKGADLTVVGAMGLQYDSNVVVSNAWAKSAGVNENSTFEQRLTALKGVKIAVTAPGSGQDQIVHYLALKAQLNPDRDMTIVSIQDGPSMLAAFSRGVIDGFAFSTPTSDFAVRDRDGFMLFHPSVGDVPELRGFLYSAMIASGDWATANKDKVVRTLNAIQRALVALHDPVEGNHARELIRAKYYPDFDKAFFEALWASALKEVATSVVPTVEQMKQVTDFTNQFGGDSISDAITKSALDARFAEAATAK